jgi:hypothetical protein
MVPLEQTLHLQKDEVTERASRRIHYSREKRALVDRRLPSSDKRGRSTQSMHSLASCPLQFAVWFADCLKSSHYRTLFKDMHDLPRDESRRDDLGSPNPRRARYIEAPEGAACEALVVIVEKPQTRYLRMRPFGDPSSTEMKCKEEASMRKGGTLASEGLCTFEQTRVRHLIR